MSGVACSLTHGLFDSLSFLLEKSMSGVACSLTHGLFDSLSCLLEKSMSAHVSVYVGKWYLLPQGY